jgi:hypothetical protein
MPRIAELPLVGSLMRRIERHGLWNTLEWAVLRALAAAFGVRVLRALVVQAVNPGSQAAADGFAHGFAMPRTMRRFAADPANEMSPFFAADAIARGDRCYAICEGTTPVSTSWYSTRPTRIGLDDLVAHFDMRYVYLYKAYTQPSHRGRRLFAAGVSHALHHYAAKGARGFISHVDATNLDSLRASQRMGYRIFGSVYVVRLFGRNFPLATPGCKAFHFWLENRPPRRNRPQRFHPAAAHANVPVV